MVLEEDGARGSGTTSNHIGSRRDWQSKTRGELECVGAAELWPENMSRFIVSSMTRRSGRSRFRPKSGARDSPQGRGYNHARPRVIRTGFRLRSGITIGG